MSLRVDMTGNSTGFQQMLNTAKTQAKAFSNSVTHEIGSSWGSVGKTFAGGIAGMFTYEGIKSGLEWFIETGKEIKETAEQVDMSTDSWQKWTSAVSKAGLSIGGFQRIIESLRAKRTEALSDPKARGELARLGFSDSEITGNMDMSEFTRRSLSNANGGDLQRKYLSDVIGNRGLKYSTALSKLPNSQALFSADEIEQATQAAAALGKVGKAIAMEGISTVRALSNSDRAAAVGLSLVRLSQAALGRGWLWNRKGSITDNVDDLESGKNINLRDLLGFKSPSVSNRTLIAALSANAGATNKSDENKKDPMDAKLAQQREEIALHEQERQQRLMDSRRGLMTIGDRRASIIGEMPKLAAQIAERTSNMNGEKFLTDAQKDELQGVTGKAREYQINALRVKYQDQTDSLQLRYNKDTTDLKEKPVNYNVDSMAKSGLYSASNVAFNPLLGAAQKTNQILTEIKTVLVGGGAKIENPYSP